MSGASSWGSLPPAYGRELFFVKKITKQKQNLVHHFPAAGGCLPQFRILLIPDVPPGA